MDQEAIIRSLIASLPEITVLAAACLLLMLDLVFKRKRVDLIGYLSLAVVVVVALETWFLVMPGEAVYSGMFIADPFSAFFKMIFYLTAALCIL
ncbi:MAG: NADH-quinone oxidoreductase subunit N, partial [Oceanicoccus sp.]